MSDRKGRSRRGSIAPSRGKRAPVARRAEAYRSAAQHARRKAAACR